MLESEKLAIAAHLHVLLRRQTGRVTDTEWMACNAEYAREVVRFARAKAQEDGQPALAVWADRLEAALALNEASRRKPGPPRPGEDAAAKAPQEPGAEGPRYVGGIR